MDAAIRTGMPQPLPRTTGIQPLTAPTGQPSRLEATRQTPQAVQREAAPERSVDTRKRLTDTDTMLARIDSKLSALNIELPENKRGFMSRLGTFGKAILTSLANIPKIAANAGIMLAKSICNIPRLITYPMRLLSDKPDNWMKSQLQGANDKLNAAKKAVGEAFEGLNASIISLGGPKTPASLDPVVITTTGLPDGKHGDALDIVTDGAMGMTNVQAGILATNIMDGSNFRINENINDKHLGSLTTHNDGDTALDMGAAPLVLGTLNTVGQIDDAMNRVSEGREMQLAASRFDRQHGTDTPETLAGRNLLHQLGSDMIDEGNRNLRRAGVGMVQNTLGGINAVAGSNRYGTAAFGDVAIGVTNVTQLAGHGLTALTATYDGVMDARAAHSGRVRKNRADAFLERTADMQNGKKIVESLDTSAVRDGVKLFRKNQDQNFKHKTLSAFRNFVVAAAATTLMVATAVAVAATPVGWALMGAAAVGAVGFGLYKAYKSIRRQENMQHLGDRLVRVQNAIKDVSLKPQTEATKAQLGELKDAERMIKRYQRQTDPTAAAADLVRVLKDGKTSKAKAHAANALETVFKINPKVFELPPQSKPYQEALKLLQGKLAIFA